MSEPNFLEKLILDEISGKNQAIHAYDKTMWTVRTGFLTLFFAGWGILLKSLVENPAKAPTAFNNNILIVMVLMSVALGCGGYIVDLNYAKRKFRVIHALDNLISAIVEKQGQVHDGLGGSEVFLLVAGDKMDENYREVSGYRHEMAVARRIYLMPMIAAILSVPFLWK